MKMLTDWMIKKAQGQQGQKKTCVVLLNEAQYLSNMKNAQTMDGSQHGPK